MVPIIVVSAVTVALAGGVIFAATNAGCKIGMQSSRCPVQTGLVTSPAAHNPTPYQYTPPPLPTQQVPPPVASDPYPPVASQPYPPLASDSQPTRDPSWPQYQYAASAAFPIYYVSSEPLPLALGLSCRLPVYAGGSGSGGFIVFPQRDFVADPRSAVAPPSPPADYTPPPQGPGYYPGPGSALSYDRALGKWLPVPSNSVSPDGQRYSWVFPGDSGIYIVNASTGTQVELGAGFHWNVLSVTNNGVYATQNTGQTALAGLWFVPLQGPPQQITSSGFWQAVGGGAAYGTVTSAVPAGATNTILRLDLKTGSTQPWFMVQNSQAFVTGFDFAGNPLIVDNYQATNPYGYQIIATSVWDVPGLGTGYAFASNPPFQTTPQAADSHGVWFTGGNQMYLFVPGEGVFVVAMIGGFPAGECA